MEEIEIIEKKKRDTQGAYGVDGFPSAGPVESILANHLVSILGLEEIAVMGSVSFPAVSLVKGGRPYSLVRIYTGQKGGDKVVAFVSGPPRLLAWQSL